MDTTSQPKMVTAFPFLSNQSQTKETPPNPNQDDKSCLEITFDDDGYYLACDGEYGDWGDMVADAFSDGLDGGYFLDCVAQEAMEYDNPDQLRKKLSGLRRLFDYLKVGGFIDDRIDFAVVDLRSHIGD